ncbi:MAG: hypothetical protein ACON41_00325 [Parvibaculales bacterium]
MPRQPQLRAYDNNQTKTYRAERAALKKLKKHTKRFETINACRAFVNSITIMPVWQSLNGPQIVPIKSMPRLGRRSIFIRRRALGLTKYKATKPSGNYEFSHISLAPREIWRGSRGGFDNFTILHELAHVVNPFQEKHGPQFLRAHLMLLKNVLGAETADIFERAYLLENLEIAPEK